MHRVPDGDFRLAMMEALPWPDATFDVVTGFNTFQYALDVPLALQEAMRVLRPDGRIAVCKWGAPQDNEFFAFLGALGGGIDLASLAAADPVSRAIDRLPLSVVATGTVPAPIEMRDDAALLGALTGAGLVTGADVLPDRVADAAGRFRRADGSYRFDNRLRYWVLRKNGVTTTGRRPPAPSPR
jgi:SAM-dependent methyltransferase